MSIRQLLLSVSIFASSFAYANPALENTYTTFIPYEDAISTRSNAKEAFTISHMPTVFNISETSATILWGTNKPAISWVEIAPDDGTHFYKTDRQKYFDYVFGSKRVGKTHRIKIDNLKPNTSYRFRIFSREVIGSRNSGIDFGATSSTRVWQLEPLMFKTLDPNKKSVRFAVVNDIHEKSDRLRKLLANVKDCDFLMMNGDIVSMSISAEHYFRSFLDALAERTIPGQPALPLFFLRGNHETRGVFAQNVMDMIPTPDGKPYYSFRIGNVAFLAIDSGEDKPDADIAYYDMINFDDFRKNQAKFFEKEIEKEEIKNAPVKIAFTHMPIGIDTKGRDWHGILHARENFAPILEKWNANLLISGHIHRRDFFPPSKNLNLPNLVNSNTEILIVDVNQTEISVKVYDTEAKLIGTHNFPIKK